VAPYLAASRPRSIEELAETALKSLGDDARPFKTWLRIAETAGRDAKGFQDQGDLEAAFMSHQDFTRENTFPL
jgi:hypothetical protein